MSSFLWTVIFLVLTLSLYLLQPKLGFSDLRRTLGVSFFIQMFYIVGHYLTEGWPFPTPLEILQIFVVVGLGTGLGSVFSGYWPLPPKIGIERVIRIFILCAPALMLGIGLHVLFQENQPNQALYLVFALAAWLGSGKHKKALNPDSEEGSKKKNSNLMLQPN